MPPNTALQSDGRIGRFAPSVSFWGAVGYSHDEKMARFVRNVPSGNVAV